MRRRGKRELAALLTAVCLLFSLAQPAAAAGSGCRGERRGNGYGGSGSRAGHGDGSRAGHGCAGGSTGEPGRDGAVSDA